MKDRKFQKDAFVCFLIFFKNENDSINILKEDCLPGVIHIYIHSSLYV